MEHEVIRLAGGPLDGRVLAWPGGDTIEFPEVRAQGVHLLSAPASGRVPFDRLVYRRSVDSPGTFVLVEGKRD